MAKPLFNTLLEDSRGFVVTLRILFRARGDVILPPFTSRVMRILLHTSPCLEPLRRLYESSRSYRPVRLSVLRRGPRRLYKVKGGSEAPLTLRAGDIVEGYISAYTGDPQALLGVFACKGALPDVYSRLYYEVVEVNIESLESLRAGLGESGVFKVAIHTPLLADTKVMTPPALRGRRLVKFNQAHRLLPTPSYLAAYATRLWLALARGDVDRSLHHLYSYAVGRLADVMLAEVDYKLRPVTAIYGRDEEGRLKTPRGPVGYVIYKILNPRIAPLLDKTLALASRLGLGRSRSIGFGEVTVEPARETPEE